MSQLLPPKMLPSMKDLHQILQNTKVRLQNKYCWDSEFMNYAVNEYHRFLQLHINNPNDVIIPGPVIDEIWHDHILHTKKYIKFCETYLNEYLHHDPYDHSEPPKDHKTNVEKTTQLYLQEFGHNPPQKYWIDPVRPIEKTSVTSYSSCSCR